MDFHSGNTSIINNYVEYYPTLAHATTHATSSLAKYQVIFYTILQDSIKGVVEVELKFIAYY